MVLGTGIMYILIPEIIVAFPTLQVTSIEVDGENLTSITEVEFFHKVVNRQHIHILWRPLPCKVELI